jgi:PAS domain S-box-containing protein
VLDVFCETDRAAAQRNTSICLEQLGQPMSWEARKWRKDRTILWVRETARAALVKQQPVLLIACEDITDRKRAEYFAEHVFETIPDIASIVDRNYRYHRANPAHERFWGISIEKIIGVHVGEVIGREAFERLAKPNLDRCFAGKEVSFNEWIESPRGRRYWAATYSPLQLEAGRVENALVLARDITDGMLASEKLRDAQAELAHANRIATIGQMTASIAHEVNQPVGAMVTNAYAALRLLSAQSPDLDQTSKALDDIIKDAKRVSNVIERIRALVKKQPTQTDMLDINEVIVETIALTRGELLRNGVSLQRELSGELPPIRGDRVQLQQVIMNLVMNAIEAMSNLEEGRRALQIVTNRDDEDAILISVRDWGPTVKQESLDRFFEAFYSTKPRGMGIGLAICRSIVESHGGRIWAARNDPRGVAIHIMLPTLGDGPS